MPPTSKKVRFFRFLCGSFMAVAAVPGAVSCDGLSPSSAVDPPWWPSLRRAQQRSRMARSATEGSSLGAASTAEYLGPARDEGIRVPAACTSRF
jgi:hypothetical protein